MVEVNMESEKISELLNKMKLLENEVKELKDKQTSEETSKNLYFQKKKTNVLFFQLEMMKSGKCIRKQKAIFGLPKN